MKTLALLGAASAFAMVAAPALADRITHPTAVFSGLDKITGRIISFEVASNETVQFGSLQITERACYTRPATETPQTVTFAEVDEIDAKKHFKRIFSGWMFAASPGLNGIEHPVYDIWLTDCKGGTEVQKTPGQTAEATPPAPPPNADQPAKPEKKKHRNDEEARIAKRRQQQQQQDADEAMSPDDARPGADRAPPARSFFPDAAGGRDPGGFY